jgi:hypothetical protein
MMKKDIRVVRSAIELLEKVLPEDGLVWLKHVAILIL